MNNIVFNISLLFIFIQNVIYSYNTVILIHDIILYMHVYVCECVLCVCVLSYKRYRISYISLLYIMIYNAIYYNNTIISIYYRYMCVYIYVCIYECICVCIYLDLSDIE